ARRSTRPDAAAWRALAQSLPWLRRLHHDTIRPPVIVSPHRSIPGTGLLVPRDLEDEPPRLIERWTAVARSAVDAHRATWRRHDRGAVEALCAWLSSAAPPLLVTGTGGILWDPDAPGRLEPLSVAIDQADGVAVAAMRADLAVVARHTRAFLAAVVD